MKYIHDYDIEYGNNSDHSYELFDKICFINDDIYIHVVQTRTSALKRSASPHSGGRAPTCNNDIKKSIHSAKSPYLLNQ